MFHTQVMVKTGQRMVIDLRRRLFDALQFLPLRHHVTTSTSDAVFRVEIDAYCLDNLVMEGIFPLATAVLTLVVMFVILLKLDVTVALLSLVTVPLLYACLRYYVNNLSDRAEQVRRSSRTSTDVSTRRSRRSSWSRASFANGSSSPGSPAWPRAR